MSNKKGAGTLIAVSFMIVIFLSGFGVYLFVFDQMGYYQESVEDMNKIDLEKSQERIVIDDYLSTIVDDDYWGGYRFKLAVINQGYEDVTLVYFGVFNETIGVSQYDPIDPPQLVKPGEMINITSTYAFEEDMGYLIHLVTKRGNIVQIYYYGEGMYGYKKGGTAGGGRHGFPYTLLLDLSADWYSALGAQAFPNHLYAYATNLAKVPMQNITFTIEFTLLTPVDPQMTPSEAKGALLGENLTDLTFNQTIQYRKYQIQEEINIPTDGIFYFEFQIDVKNWKDDVKVRVSLSAEGYVMTDEGPEPVTSNIANIHFRHG